MNHGDGSMMGHTNMTMPSSSRKHYIHMTFFWGSHSEILFDGWPGACTSMYFLALVLVFLLSIALEWFNHCDLTKKIRRKSVAAELVRTLVHGVRVGVMNLLMLAVMSFNAPLLLVAIVGRAVGFFFFFDTKDGDGEEKLGVAHMEC